MEVHLSVDNTKVSHLSLARASCSLCSKLLLSLRFTPPPITLSRLAMKPSPSGWVALLKYLLCIQGVTDAEVNNEVDESRAESFSVDATGLTGYRGMFSNCAVKSDHSTQQQQNQHRTPESENPRESCCSLPALPSRINLTTLTYKCNFTKIMVLSRNFGPSPNCSTNC